MGVDLHFGYYPKKCVDKDIMPYLDVDIDDNWLDGNHQAPHFYDVIRQYSTWDEDNGCWLIEDPVKLFEMAGKQEIPGDMADYITECYNDGHVFILWKR